MPSNTVFISYAREDSRYAERVYKDLREAHVNAWLDTRCLLPGQNWKREISRVIRESAFFIAIISKASLNKRGTVQSEIKRALEVLSDIPSDQIFLIPVRIDACSPADEELQHLNWVDLFPNYRDGLNRILSVLSGLKKLPLQKAQSKRRRDKRAPIHYTPYRTFADFAMDLIERLPRSASLADPNYAMFVKYKTTLKGVKLPAGVKDKYPDEITIVLQHQFEALTASRAHFTVVMWFSGDPATLSIPYKAIREIVVPSIGLRVQQFVPD